MKTLRAGWRGMLLALSIVIGAAPLFIANLLQLINENLGLRMRCLVVRNWARAVAHILKIRIIVRGPVPKPPFMLVVNHLSYIDIILLFSQIDCIFVAKKDLRSWPLLGFLIQASGNIFVDRESRRDIPRVNALIARNINKHHGLILFPEGTSTNGESVLPFKPSLLAYPASQQQAVSYASIRYQTPLSDMPAYLSVCFWGDMAFPRHLFGLLKLSEIQATLTFGNETLIENDRKILAQKLWQLVNETFEPVVKTEGTCKPPGGSKPNLKPKSRYNYH